MERLGIDIGSKTLKLVLLDEGGDVVFSSYQKHKSHVAQALIDAVHAIVWRKGDRMVRMTVTGSAGMRVSELFDIPFVQEVVALKRAVLADYPDADAILEMGGEDTKLIYLTGAPEQRMNNVCAGGTGSFIETMGGLMGVRTRMIDRMAMGYTTIYPIASRCAVFAKSDVRPLLNAGARKEDIAASVLDAVCTQAIAGLSAGRPLTGKVLLLGGPFQHISALREAFCRVSGFKRDNAIVPKEAHLFVARGAAMSGRASREIALSEFEKLLRSTDFASETGIVRLPALFNSEEELEAFRERHSRTCVPRVNMIDAGIDLFMGVDAGSTTAKIVIIDANGAVAAYEYDRHRGNVVECITGMMQKIYSRLYASYAEKHVIRGSYAIGYGEELCRTAFGIDAGEVETVAHLRAATALDPEVDFLLDIGGQDVKCFYVKDGVIQDVVLNEACSSGCGSLFDSVAKSLGRTRGDFVSDALHATAPVDLGTRCTTFMNSRIRHAQKEGASKEDIAAGVAYATARNALFKVVRQPDFSKVGKHIVVQGGAFGNDALLRAFELETGVEVLRPDLAPIMGAWGAALLARDVWLAQRREDPDAANAVVSGLIEPRMLNRMDMKKNVVRCTGCSNACELRVTRFAEREGDAMRRTYGTGIVEGSERVLVTGNRCERGALLYGGHADKRTPPPNLIAYKRALLAHRKSISARGKTAEGPARSEGLGAASPSVRVGVPRALALYESYPFWQEFFAALGIELVEGAEASERIFRLGMASIPAEGMCYPAKLVYGQAVDLVKRGADAIFAPAMHTGFARFGLAGLPFDAGLMTCPLVESMGMMVAGNAEGSPIADVRIAIPDLRDARTIDDACGPICAALADIGLEYSAAVVQNALETARDGYRSIREKLASRTREVLAAVDAGEYPGIVLVGHAYHAAEGISHGIDGLLGELGYAVLERTDFDCLGNCNADVGTGAEDSRWFENADALARIESCADHPNLQAIIIRSFGCGIDALIADEIRDRLRKGGSIYTELKMDQIVDLATIRIRLRSLAYAHRQREGASEVFPLTVPPEAYRPKEGTSSTRAVRQSVPVEERASRKKNEKKASKKPDMLVDPSPPSHKKSLDLSMIGVTAGILGIEIERPTSLDVNIPGPAGTPVNLRVPRVDGAPAPGTSAKGAGPSLLQLEEARAFSRGDESSFSHSYQGLAWVSDVPKPDGLEPPGVSVS